VEYLGGHGGVDENAPCGLDTCLTKKLAHTACMKALSEALGKVNL